MRLRASPPFAALRYRASHHAAKKPPLAAFLYRGVPSQGSSPLIRLIKKECTTFLVHSFLFGGDKGDRTPDLVIANHALSQLSYIPISIFIIAQHEKIVKGVS